MNYMKNKRGYTLVELILVISIIGVIITAIGSFLINNYKLFYKGDNQINIQNELQISMAYIVNNIMESSRVESIYDGNNESLLSESGSVEVKGIVFLTTGGDRVTIERDSDNNLYMTKSSSEKVKIGESIISFKVSPLNSNFSNASGVKIELTGKGDEYTVKINNAVYFRNR